MSEIGVWGGPGSGKSTYLSSLALAALYKSEGDWIVRGRDDLEAGSIRFVTNSTRMLHYELDFPPKTVGRRKYALEVSGTPSERLSTKLFGRKPRTITFNVRCLDVPGEDYHQIEEPDDELWAYLGGCNGLLFLFDPEAERQHPGSNFNCIHGASEWIFNYCRENALLKQGKLPHRLAICLSKVDIQEVCDTLVAQNLLQVPANQPPHVDDPASALGLFMDLASLRTLEHAFYRENIRYFALSSVGFYPQQEPHQAVSLIENRDMAASPAPWLGSGAFGDVSSPGPAAAKLRGTPNPFNVFEPLIWLAGE